MTFNADGTTGTLFSVLKTQCFQISDEFLIMRLIRYWYKEWQYWQYICKVRKKFSFFWREGFLEDLRVGVETLLFHSCYRLVSLPILNKTKQEGLFKPDRSFIWYINIKIMSFHWTNNGYLEHIYTL